MSLDEVLYNESYYERERIRQDILDLLAIYPTGRAPTAFAHFTKKTPRKNRGFHFTEAGLENATQIFTTYDIPIEPTVFLNHLNDYLDFAVLQQSRIETNFRISALTVMGTKCNSEGTSVTRRIDENGGIHLEIEERVFTKFADENGEIETVALADGHTVEQFYTHRIIFLADIERTAAGSVGLADIELLLEVTDVTSPELVKSDLTKIAWLNGEPHGEPRDNIIRTDVLFS